MKEHAYRHRTQRRARCRAGKECPNVRYHPAEAGKDHLSSVSLGKRQGGKQRIGLSLFRQRDVGRYVGEGVAVEGWFLYFLGGRREKALAKAGAV